MSNVIQGYILPGLPHPLLCPEKNAGYQRLRNGFEAVRQEIESSEADVILIYSTMWPSVIGHQILSRPEPEWIHVDELFHDLGSIPYRFKVDSDFAHAYSQSAQDKGLMTRTIDYHGFPIGPVVTPPG